MKVLFTETTNDPRLHTQQKVEEIVTLCYDVGWDKIPVFHFLDITHGFNISL